LSKFKPKKFIPVHKPIFDKDDVYGISKVIRSDWISEGKETKKFEENFRKFIGTKYAVTTTSGTTALFLALAACGIKKDVEVIIPNLTFAATANAVKLLGAKPILAEIDENTFTLSLESLKKKITRKTKAVIPVHLNGRSPDLEELIEICKKKDLKIIEDAAQALGSKYKKKYLGSFGDAAAFSFSPPKIITLGQGGIVTTNCFSVFNKLRDLKDQGRHNKSDHHPIVGYNFKITDIQAALGNSQFAKLKSRLRKTKYIYQQYFELLRNEKSIIMPPKRTETHIWYFDIISSKRHALVEFLLKSKIRTRLFHKPLNVHKAFKTNQKFPISCKISKRGLYLPSSSNLTSKDIEYTCEKINKFYKKFR